mmetsp:Transcript_55163/g.76502  ORF Transcript_55163/g.76502 Transcript_55163/m.76502 type:complete len:87 (-) Transcript_55163:907-1167(-)
MSTTIDCLTPSMRMPMGIAKPMVPKRAVQMQTREPAPGEKSARVHSPIRKEEVQYMDEGTDAKKAWEGDVQEFSVKTKRLEITTQI